MSLNRLLSFVPFVRRPGSDSDHPAAPSAFMVFFSLNLLAVVWGLTLLVSLAALLIFAVLTPGVSFFSTADARDAEIESIKSVTDAGLLQRKAVYDISQGSASSANATYLCHFAVDAFLLVMIGSIAGLLLIYWIKRHLKFGEDSVDTSPTLASLELLNRLKREQSEGGS